MLNSARDTCQNKVQERSIVRRILSACEKMPGKQDKSRVNSVSTKTWNLFAVCALFASPEHSTYE